MVLFPLISLEILGKFHSLSETQLLIWEKTKKRLE